MKGVTLLGNQSIKFDSINSLAEIPVEPAAPALSTFYHVWVSHIFMSIGDWSQQVRKSERAKVADTSGVDNK